MKGLTKRSFYGLREFFSLTFPCEGEFSLKPFFASKEIVGVRAPRNCRGRELGHPETTLRISIRLSDPVKRDLRQYSCYAPRKRPVVERAALTSPHPPKTPPFTPPLSIICDTPTRGGIARCPAIPRKRRCDRYSYTLQRDRGGGRNVGSPTYHSLQNYYSQLSYS